MEKEQNLKILPATFAIRYEIGTIERSGQSSPWSQESIDEELSNIHSFHFVLREQSDVTIRSFVLCRLILDELHIHNICTLPEFRRRGYGSKVLLHALQESERKNAKRAFLEVRSGNGAAIALYRALGFETDSIRKQYYQSGEDALVMRKEFGTSTKLHITQIMR